MGITRKTKSVELILSQFEEESGAISVSSLVERLHSEINKTTIYRVLEKLEDDGVVHSIIGKSGIKWYAKCDGCSEHKHKDTHPHFQCVECGKIDCLPVEVSIPEIENREVLVSQILIQGKCEACLS